MSGRFLTGVFLLSIIIITQIKMDNLSRIIFILLIFVISIFSPYSPVKSAAVIVPAS
jgi:hypothetical protein